MKRFLPVILSVSCLIVLLAALFLGFHALPDSNTATPVSDMLAFSKTGGFFRDPFNLELQTSLPDAEIRYTMNGSEPDQESKLYNQPISISVKNPDVLGTAVEGITGVIVRARVFQNNQPVGKVLTHTYLVGSNIDTRFTLPVISLVTGPDNLYNYETGIYIRGKVFDDWKKRNPRAPVNGASPANYNQKGKEWERPVHIEFFEPDGTLSFSQDAGVRVFGAWSREYPQKSLRLFARSEYDEQNSFDYALFPWLKSMDGQNRPITTFKRFILRNSGNDFYSTMFRDAMIHRLAQDTGSDIQSYRPAVIYINGRYWGIQNIREDNDENYIVSHYNADPAKIAILGGNEAGYKADYGTAADVASYQQLTNFAWNHDLSEQSNFQKISEMMDVENYLKYSVYEIYCANTDWPQNNVRLWRYRTDAYDPSAPYGLDGRWRWMLKDTDFGFGLVGNYHENTLVKATARNKNSILLHSLLKNDSFRINFINYFADALNSPLSTAHVLEIMNEAQLGIAQEIETHLKRWNIHSGQNSYWDNTVSTMRKFAERRPEYMYSFLKGMFHLQDTVNLRVIISEGGKIQINTLSLEASDQPWQGKYFPGIPIKIAAVADKGYTFAGWTLDNQPVQLDTLTLTQDAQLTAHFEKLPDATSIPEQKIVINEYSSADQQGGNTDWIELYNAGSEKINLKNYFLSDRKENLKKWQLSSVQVEPGGHLHIWCSGKDLRNPKKELHTNFSISEGETIYLTHFDGKTILDQMVVVKTQKSTSYGRYPDGSENLMYLDTATPGSVNKNTPLQYILPSQAKNRILLNGTLLESSIAPKMVDGVVYAPLQPLMQAMDFKITGMALPRRNMEGEEYVPLQILCNKLGKKFYWCESAQSAVITQK